MSYCPKCDQLRGPFYGADRSCLCSEKLHVEWGRSLTTWDYYGNIVNIAEDLNRTERIKKK